MAFASTDVSDAAWLFPGQGATYPGMGRALVDASDRAQDLVRRASDVSGQPLERIRRDGPPATLRRPEVQEPLLTALSIAYADALRDRGYAPRATAGYSAGEVAAYYAAGVFDDAVALQAATIRGRALRDATGTGQMLGVRGLAPEVVDGALDDIDGVSLAARNAPDHAAVAGRSDALEVAARRLGDRGGVVRRLDVDGPWHSPLARPAADAIADRLDDLPFDVPDRPVVCCATGTYTDAPDALRDALAEQVCRPVQWLTVIRRLRDGRPDEPGATGFVDAGAGRVLYGFLRRTWRSDDAPTLTYLDDGRGGTTLPLGRRVAG